MMFIHRDDSDPAKKGLADLIVAKHRNGPTDTVPLTFLPHLTAVPQPRHRVVTRTGAASRRSSGGSSGTSATCSRRGPRTRSTS